MRFRRTTTAVTVAIATLALAACGDDGDDGGSGGDSAEPSVAETPEFEAGTTMARLADQGTIRVGTKVDQPGFGLENLDGEVEGFDVEVAKIIAGALGIEEGDIEFVETPSAVREEVLEGGEVDMVVATYTINDARRERVSFAGPYYEAGQQVMVASDNDEITGPESFTDNPDLKVCS